MLLNILIVTLCDVMIDDVCIQLEVLKYEVFLAE